MTSAALYSSLAPRRRLSFNNSNQISNQTIGELFSLLQTKARSVRLHVPVFM